MEIEQKHLYILDKVKTEQKQIIKSEQYTNFLIDMMNYSSDERFEFMAKLVIQGDNLGVDDVIISNCKLHLKSKAFSGITGSITEKNINFIYELLTKYS